MQKKRAWVWKETLKIHRLAPETRIASSLSAVDILVALFYGGIIRYDAADIGWEDRDRFIVSKGHGSIAFYPILSDLGYFPISELAKVCTAGSFLGGIPDCVIPGYETTNGSLGHGIGVACGMALALKRKKKEQKVFVLVGDGELYEGANWEAIMFAKQHELDNIIVIVDNNKICMLDYCKNTIDLEPLGDKFKAFGWDAFSVDGHNLGQLHDVLSTLKQCAGGRPNMLLANTVKGKGVHSLESDTLCHIRSLRPEYIDELIAGSE